MAKPELHVLAVRVQIVQDRVAFRGGQAVDMGGVGRAQIQGFATGHRVLDHQRVQVAAVHLHDLGIALMADDALAQRCRHGPVHVVPGAEPVEVVLHTPGQAVIGRGHADPARIAATGGKDLGVGHGDNRRVGQEALVVVPHIRPVTQPGVDHGDLFKACAQVGIERVNFGLAEISCNGQVLFWL